MLPPRYFSMNRRLQSAASALCALALACSGSSESEEPTPEAPTEEARHGLSAEEAGQLLAKVGDTAITAGAFADRLAEQSPYLRARYNSPERRREFLENMIRMELLAQEAERRGLDEDPAIRRTIEQTMVQQMMKDLFEDQIRLADITDAQIREYYEAHPEEFHQPAQVRASHILFADRAAAEAVLRQLQESPEDQALFRSLSETHNTDPLTSGPRHGDLQFFSADGSRGRAAPRGNNVPNVPEAVAQAAFAITGIGGIHGEIVETEAGFHIVKLTSRRSALSRSFDEARGPIQNRLWRERRQSAVDEFVAELRQNAEIEENTAALANVRIEGVTAPVRTTPATSDDDEAAASDAEGDTAASDPSAGETNAEPAAEGDSQ